MSLSVLVAYSFPTFFRQVYAMLFESGLHASCSTPPNGSIGQSKGSPSSISVPSEMLEAPSKSAMNGWGEEVLYWSQCLYIKSLMTMPVANGRSFSFFSMTVLLSTLWIKMTFFSSGENKNPSTSFCAWEIWRAFFPSIPTDHTCDDPLREDKKAISFPFLMNTGELPPLKIAWVLSVWRSFT